MSASRNSHERIIPPTLDRNGLTPEQAMAALTRVMVAMQPMGVGDRLANRDSAMLIDADEPEMASRAPAGQRRKAG